MSKGQITGARQTGKSGQPVRCGQSLLNGYRPAKMSSRVHMQASHGHLDMEVVVFKMATKRSQHCLILLSLGYFALKQNVVLIKCWHSQHDYTENSNPVARILGIEAEIFSCTV